MRYTIVTSVMISLAAPLSATLITGAKNISTASLDTSVVTMTSTADVLFNSPNGRLRVNNHINLDEGGVLRSNAESHPNGSLCISATNVADATMNLNGTVRNDYASGDFRLSAIDGASIRVGATAQFVGNIAFDIFNGTLYVDNGSSLSLSQLNLGKDGGSGTFNMTTGNAAIKTLRVGADMSGATASKSGNISLSGNAAITSAGGNGAVVGTSQTDAAGFQVDESIFKITNTATYTTDAAFDIKSSGTLHLAPTAESNIPMLNVGSMDFQREGGANIGKGLLLDGAGIAPTSDEFYTALIKIEAGGTLSFNGAEFALVIDENTTVFQIRDFLADNDLIVFENFDAPAWDSVDINNIVWDSQNGIIGLSLPPIPEPSAYASILGLCALAFSAYRRRIRYGEKI